MARRLSDSGARGRVFLNSIEMKMVILSTLLVAGLSVSNASAQCRYAWEIIDGPFCASHGGPETFHARTMDDDGNAAGFNVCFLTRK
ncbi:MAG: hypothetical protein O7G85_17270, partial [Planctomycetota bacterium]|nr:hypothetical protein [Planctomycetota bacterium]